MAARGRFRRTVVRGRRRYSVCGLRKRPPAPVVRVPIAGVWLPGAGFLLVLIFSAYLMGRPAPFPLRAETALQRATVAHFSIDDFANASR